jgi:hypothetical protein
MATFDKVFNAEHDEIPSLTDTKAKDVQAEKGNQTTFPPTKGVGLAFSGGGIRSATFNLGILQGLSAANLLSKIDYLSTVSGGGYVGSWLISWIKRAGGVTEVEKQLGAYPVHYIPNKGLSAEPEEVSFLRDYSNYMTPRLGLFGADTWAGIATYLRNVILNQLILVALLGAIVLIPWAVLTACRALAPRVGTLCAPKTIWELAANLVAFNTNRTYLAVALAVGAVALMARAVYWASGQCALSSYTRVDPPKDAGQGSVLLSTVLPLFSSAVLTMFALWLGDSCKLDKWNPWWWAVAGAIPYCGAHILGVRSRLKAIQSLVDYERQANEPLVELTKDQRRLIPSFALLAGGAGGLLLELLNKLFIYWKFCGRGFPHALTWGPVLFVVMFLLVGALHIGLLKTLIQNEEQEWWARVGGLLLILSAAWTALFALTIFVPWLFATKGQWIKTKTIALLGWLATTAFGVISGKSSKTSGKGDGNRGLEFVAILSPYVFVLGLMVMLSWGAFEVAKYKTERTDQCVICSITKTVLGKSFGISLHVDESAGSGAILAVSGRILTETTGSANSEENIEQAEKQFWKDIECLSAHWIAVIIGLLLLIAFLLSWRVDINIFSMNLLYRNRLVRCYLGASRRDCLKKDKDCKGRRPNPFTGFDPNDDLPLALFRRGPKPNDEKDLHRWESRWREAVVAQGLDAAVAKNVEAAVKEHPYIGPYPILCGALNVTHGERLAWQERKAESFAFAPIFCGYEFVQMHTDDGGYQPTMEYAYSMDKQDPSHPDIGGVRLGTAMSISGAAASPNMGFHTSPPLAFLMTMFDVRLGWWLANPRYKSSAIEAGRLKLKLKGAPRFSLYYLLSELFASTTDRSKFVYLSDGGHFENLAVYELIRRRCKFIIACDADADEDVEFGDLGNMIRKCRSDLGVEIKLENAALLKPHKKTKFAKLHAVVGTIQYPKQPRKPGEPESKPEDDLGYILYIKPTITKDLPRDVLAYSDTHPPFPYQTTADQWFDESQFESYRRLGQFTMDGLTGGTPAALPDVEKDLFDRAKVLMEKANSKPHVPDTKEGTNETNSSS